MSVRPSGTQHLGGTFCKVPLRCGQTAESRKPKEERCSPTLGGVEDRPVAGALKRMHLHAAARLLMVLEHL
jgi:hypothetical protein